MKEEVWNALVSAAKEIRGVMIASKGPSDEDSDEDNDSEEIVFTLKNGKHYLLSLEEYVEAPNGKGDQEEAA